MCLHICGNRMCCQVKAYRVNNCSTCFPTRDGGGGGGGRTIRNHPTCVYPRRAPFMYVGVESWGVGANQGTARQEADGPREGGAAVRELASEVGDVPCLECGKDEGAECFCEVACRRCGGERPARPWQTWPLPPWADGTGCRCPIDVHRLCSVFFTSSAEQCATAL